LFTNNPFNPLLLLLLLRIEERRHNYNSINWKELISLVKITTMVKPPLIRIKTLCSFLRTKERVSKTHKTSNFIHDFQSKEKNYKKAIYRQGK